MQRHVQYVVTSYTVFCFTFCSLTGVIVSQTNTMNYLIPGVEYRTRETLNPCVIYLVQEMMTTAVEVWRNHLVKAKLF